MPSASCGENCVFWLQGCFVGFVWAEWCTTLQDKLGLYSGFLKNNGSLPCKSEAKKVGRNLSVLQEDNWWCEEVLNRECAVKITTSKQTSGGRWGIWHFFCKTITCFKSKGKSFPWEGATPGARNEIGSQMQCCNFILIASKQAQILCTQWAFSRDYILGRGPS